MDYGAKFASGLPYGDFLTRYGSVGDRRRWDDFHARVSLSDSQQQLLKSFVREMQVLVMAGTWCGDCVNQCPIFDHFAQATDRIQLRFFDRDDNPDLATALQTCGAPRVPAVVFLSEDGKFCGRAGDRTLAKYRQMASSLTGAACSTGIHDSLTDAVVQEWLDEFERIQWMLRTSGRLRQLHGD
ncbi:MAG: thioredoxin family protein [Planctomycetaceae bacterium]|nr:thioredoxin family protein [Planctomycetaceae bacterium]